MSVINGIWHKDGRALEKERLLQQASFNVKFAPDGTNVQVIGTVGMSFQGFHTHERSSFEPGPWRDPFGNSAAVDGRIDNGEELSQELRLSYDETGDTALVLAAFRKWGEGCFNRIVGDWTVAIWDGNSQNLYLARDHAGTRTLYYAETGHSVEWSTYPESLIPLSADFKLCDDYAVRYLACLSLGDLTPYDRIRTVQPGHFLHFSKTSPGRKKRYWNPELREYCEDRSEESYRDEFLNLFREAVKRRVPQSNNLICHLSGGMDSSAIVCVADLLTREGELSSQVRTLSFSDPTEPNWDDHLYYTVVESQRGKVGIHLSGSLIRRSFERSPAFYPLPGADGYSTKRELEFENSIGPGTVRAIVAGHGGDELLGGRSDPIPELADYLYRFQWSCFMSSGFKWARSLRRPLIAITHDASRFIWNQYPRPKRVPESLPPWMQELTIEREPTGALRLWQSRALGHLPSELDKQDTWENLADTLPHLFHAHAVRYEYRYPFLDKELVEFLLRVPVNQLRRPHRRRYMMRRALQGIVPEAILERRRKAYISRSPQRSVQESFEKITDLISNGELTRKGIIDHSLLVQALTKIVHGKDTPHWLPSINRLIELELWMKQDADAMANYPEQQDLHVLCSHNPCRNSQRGET